MCLLDRLTGAPQPRTLHDDANVSSANADALEQLQDAQHAVVDVAETACLALFCVVQPSAPVDDVVRLARVEAVRAPNAAAGADLAELK